MNITASYDNITRTELIRGIEGMADRTLPYDEQLNTINSQFATQLETYRGTTLGELRCEAQLRAERASGATGWAFLGGLAAVGAGAFLALGGAAAGGAGAFLRVHNLAALAAFGVGVGLIGLSLVHLSPQYQQAALFGQQVAGWGEVLEGAQDPRGGHRVGEEAG